MRKRILIVEDDEDQRDLLRMALEQGDYAVIASLAAEPALAYAQLFKPELILLDIGLGGQMDGLQALAWLKANQSTASVPIIMVSAFSDEARIQQAREAGAVDYVTKPYNPPGLLLRVERALASHREE